MAGALGRWSALHALRYLAFPIPSEIEEARVALDASESLKSACENQRSFRRRTPACRDRTRARTASRCDPRRRACCIARSRPRNANCRVADGVGSRKRTGADVLAASDASRGTSFRSGRASRAGTVVARGVNFFPPDLSWHYLSYLGVPVAQTIGMASAGMLLAVFSVRPWPSSSQRMRPAREPFRRCWLRYERFPI